MIRPGSGWGKLGEVRGKGESRCRRVSSRNFQQKSIAKLCANFEAQIISDLATDGTRAAAKAPEIRIFEFREFEANGSRWIWQLTNKWPAAGVLGVKRDVIFVRFGHWPQPKACVGIPVVNCFLDERHRIVFDGWRYRQQDQTARSENWRRIAEFMRSELAGSAESGKDRGVWSWFWSGVGTH